MNVVFLSPDFPPNYYTFCVRLRAFGVNVLGISDQPYDSLRPELRGALVEYYRVSDLHNYDELVRALGYLTYRYGKIDRVDSLNEYWLETEARLRSDFNIEGFQISDMPNIKRKSVMKRLFEAAGVNVARGQPARDPDQVRAFVAELGYPVVAKPDVGVGAARTYKIADPEALEVFLADRPNDYFLEAYIHGVIQTFDGLADRRGNPVFCTSMQYSQGVMEVVNADDDVYYYTLREVPADLEEAGRNIIKMFGVRERFFHFEFFRTAAGGLVALEVNMRPPGGLSIDMFNYANEIDLYAEWASVMVQNRFTTRYSSPYHVCYVGRKHDKPYVLTHDEVLAQYDAQIVHHQPLNPLFRRAMGDYGYLLRSPNLDDLLAAAGVIQEKRT